LSYLKSVLLHIVTQFVLKAVKLYDEVFGAGSHSKKTRVPIVLLNLLLCYYNYYYYIFIKLQVEAVLWLFIYAILFLCVFFFGLCFVFCVCILSVDFFVGFITGIYVVKSQHIHEQLLNWITGAHSISRYWLGILHIK
jgi:hypothetical protein